MPRGSDSEGKKHKSTPVLARAEVTDIPRCCSLINLPSCLPTHWHTSISVREKFLAIRVQVTYTETESQILANKPAYVLFFSLHHVYIYKNKKIICVERGAVRRIGVRAEFYILDITPQAAMRLVPAYLRAVVFIADYSSKAYIY